jgi:hypothetical protein
MVAQIDQRTKDLIGIAEGMFTAKHPYDSYCQSVAEICYPMRADFTQTLNLGDEFMTGVVDSTTINARETLGNMLESLLRQGDWFKVGTGDPDRDEKPANARALDYATKFLMRVIRDPRTRFQPMIKECDMDWVAFGSPVMSWETDKDLTHFISRAWHPRDCAWAYNEAGVLDTMYRYFYPTARDIVRKIESKAWSGPAHPTVVKAAEKEPFRKFKVCHIMMPGDEYHNGDRDADGRRYKLPYASVYVDIENQTKLNERGSRMMLYNAPRWRTFGGHTQGFSPVAMNALPDMRSIQQIALTIIEQAEKSIDPPMIGRADMFGGRGVNLYSGGFTGVELPDDAKLQDNFTTISTAENFGPALQVKMDVREAVAEGWLLNKLFLPRLGDMRELEVATRNEEFRRAALPFFTPLETEYHSPILGTVFDLARELNVIDAESFPPELQGRDTQFTFESPLKEIEGRKVVESFFASVQIAGAAAEIEQKVDSINWSKASEDAIRGAGAQPDWMLDEKEKKAARDETKQLQNLQQGAAVAREGAAVVADMANATMAAEQAGLAA